LTFQSCGTLRATIDHSFLQQLESGQLPLDDERAFRGTSILLGIKLFIVSTSSAGITTRLFTPFGSLSTNNIPTLALGHIAAGHFVPLQLKGWIGLVFDIMYVYYVH
jgi:hypothetical protein